MKPAKKQDNGPVDQVFFENCGLRRLWHQEQWFYSVVDVVRTLTDSENPRRYWSDLKIKMAREEGCDQLYEKIVHFKLPAEDGKMRETDCASVEGILRIVQSIPSRKAEPFKQWLARIGHERLQEIADPELALSRARAYWQKHGRSASWIQQRMMGQETRHKLTDYWKNHEIREGKEFALLTNLIHEEWAGIGVQEHRELKGLTTQNLRDHMSEEELIFTALAELSTRRIAEKEDADGLEENKKAAKAGGRIARNAKEELEAKTGRKVVTGENFLPSKPQKLLG